VSELDDLKREIAFLRALVEAQNKTIEQFVLAIRPAKPPIATLLSSYDGYIGRGFEAKNYADYM
jgi:hypothetical protein